MKIYFLVVKNFYTYVPSIIVYKLPLSILRIMTATVSVKLDTLIKRLNVAEKRAKLLNHEVKSIKKEILRLKSNVSSLQSSSLTENGCTTTTTRSISRSSSDSTDGPIHENKRTKVSFNEENGYVIVYTDGACENNGKPNAKAGIGVWFGDNHPLNVSLPVEGKSTNNTAEIQACVKALNVLEGQGVEKVNLYTDSQFTINCMTKWINNWKRNNWRTSAGTSVKNKEDLQKLDQVINKFVEVKWAHVTGHTGIKGNEEADKLARQGALKYRSS